jgi:hypothetical protein
VRSSARFCLTDKWNFSGLSAVAACGRPQPQKRHGAMKLVAGSPATKE